MTFNGVTRLVLLGCALVAATSCRRARFTQPMTLGGQSISAEVLNHGYEAYTHYCYACHGEKGDGQGPSAPGMRPPPRDLRQGTFKFGGVPAGELPNDDDLDALIRNGLAGTPMLPWDITPPERHAIIQYIKTFSERWKTETPGSKIKPDSPDPWRGREAEAIARGKAIYHLAGVEMDPATGQLKSVLAGCNTCHPSYVPKKEMDALSMAILAKPAEFRDDMFRPALKESEFVVGEHKTSVIAIDFLFHRVKNGASVEELFRTIAAGIGGTAMPQWKGAIKDEDLWALSHYIKSLVVLRDTRGAAALTRSLAD